MRALTTSTVLATVLGLAISASAAGTVALQWDPADGASGYRVFYGTAPGNYTTQVDTGSATQTTVSGLADCMPWYFAVKAYDGGGNFSTTYSNEVTGWPRPSLTNVSPATAEQGRRLTLTIDGSNFKSGATVTFSTPGLTVNAVTVQSCNRLTVDVTVGTGATVGGSNLELMNGDRTFGSYPSALTVQAAVAPMVAVTAPINGATQVPTSVQPTVTFSEAMVPSTISASTVQIVDASGTAVAQAAGSPTLSSDGRTATLRPAAVLTEGRTYRLRVVGGTSGVLDLAGLPLSSTFLQGTGFSTIADTTAPAVAGMASSDLTSSSARILWTTNEPADGQVSYRRAGDSAYLETALDPALVTSHAAVITGLSAGATYQYHVSSTDAAGNTTTSADATFSTPSPAQAALQVEAEDGVNSAPIRVISGTGAFDGGWVDVPAGSPVGSASAPTGTVTYDVYVPAGGSWTLWVRMFAPSTDADSWFESLDGAPRQAIIAPELGTWVWVAGRSYTLTSGLHRVELVGREEQTRADRILLTNDASFVPTAVPGSDTLSPLPVATFTVAPGSSSNTLSWKASSSADHARTVIRYRSDGVFPRTPADGLPVLDQPGAPNSTGTYVHGGLSNGTTYTYAAFSVDSAGNGSNPTDASGTPGNGNQSAPGRVKNNRRR
jgi:hypothetical protein